jgi:phosphohistidine phosphatase SixA
MKRGWFILGALLVWMCTPPLRAQQTPEGLQAQLLQQQKAAYYAQVEYQRCRSDVIELLAKSEPIEQRAKALEAEVQKLTEELTAVKGKLSEKPSN